MAINIIGNFLINAISLMVLRNRVKQKLHYQRTNHTIFNKSNIINGWDKPNTAVKYKINISFLTFNTLHKTLQ